VELIAESLDADTLYQKLGRARFADPRLRFFSRFGKRALLFVSRSEPPGEQPIGQRAFNHLHEFDPESSMKAISVLGLFQQRQELANDGPVRVTRVEKG